MTYDRLNIDDVRGTSQADYLVSLEAAFQIRAGHEVLYDDPAFPS